MSGQDFIHALTELAVARRVKDAARRGGLLRTFDLASNIKETYPEVRLTTTDIERLVIAEGASMGLPMQLGRVGPR
jgi:hypothetical protein